MLTRIVPARRIRRICQELIHRSAWRNCLENSRRSLDRASSTPRSGRSGLLRPLLVSFGTPILPLSRFSKRFRKVNSPKFAGTRNGATPHKRRAGRLVPALDVAFSKGFALGVGPYLAVDLRDEGLAVLVLLLELPNLLELLGRKAVDPPGDLVHAQTIVVSGSKGAKDGGP